MATIAAAKTKMDKMAMEMEAKVIAWRRDLHQNPELSNRETRTAEKVAAHLRDLKFDAKQFNRHRQSTRSDYDRRPLGATDLNLLAQAASVPGVDVVLITDWARIAKVTDLVVAGNSAQMGDAAFVRELKHWLRFNPKEALAKADGLFSLASGSPEVPTWLGPTMFDQFSSAATENEKYARQLRSSAGIVVFAGERADPEHWVRVGRACQRFALQATAMGLKHAFVNQPVEVPALRSELAALVGLPGRRPDIVMRFGHGPTLPFSARRPLETVIMA